MTQDPAVEEIRRAVLAYFGLTGLRTGSRTPRQALARVALARLLQDLLGEGKTAAHERARLDRHEQRHPKVVTEAQAELEQHLDQIVRSMQTTIPFLRIRRGIWLQRRGHEQQRRLEIVSEGEGT
jgi:predicted thioredoxin/glutaredoxin